MHAYRVCVCWANSDSPHPIGPAPPLLQHFCWGGMCGPPPTPGGCANIPDRAEKEKEGEEQRRLRERLFFFSFFQSKARAMR